MCNLRTHNCTPATFNIPFDEEIIKFSSTSHVMSWYVVWRTTRFSALTLTPVIIQVVYHSPRVAEHQNYYDCEKKGMDYGFHTNRNNSIWWSALGTAHLVLNHLQIELQICIRVNIDYYYYWKMLERAAFGSIQKCVTDENWKSTKTTGWH